MKLLRLASYRQSTGKFRDEPASTLIEILVEMLVEIRSIDCDESHILWIHKTHKILDLFTLWIFAINNLRFGWILRLEKHANELINCRALDNIRNVASGLIRFWLKTGDLWTGWGSNRRKSKMHKVSKENNDSSLNFLNFLARKHVEWFETFNWSLCTQRIAKTH